MDEQLRLEMEIKCEMDTARRNKRKADFAFETEIMGLEAQLKKVEKANDDEEKQKIETAESQTPLYYKIRCKNCIFCDTRNSANSPKGDSSGTLCRRRAPIDTGQAHIIFPKINSEQDWCGEFANNISSNDKGILSFENTTKPTTKEEEERN